MDPQVADVVDRAIAAARAGLTNDRAVALLWLLMKRAAHRPGSSAFSTETASIEEWHGAEAARLEVTKNDVGEVIARLTEELDALAPDNPVVISLLLASRDYRALRPLLSLLDTFTPPISGSDEITVTSLLSFMHEWGDSPAVAESLARWTNDPGEPGDRARETLAIPKFPETEWEDRIRRWRSVEDVAQEAAAAIPFGWDDAPPIRILKRLLIRERARAVGDGDEHMLATEMIADERVEVPPFDVTPELLARIATTSSMGAADDIASVGPLASILVLTATEETVPLLLDVLRRNEARHGCFAEVTRDAIVDALHPFTHRDDVQRALAERR